LRRKEGAARTQAYEQQTEEEAVAEDEAAYEDSTQAIMEVPRELVPNDPGTDHKAQTVT
jgi:hypothetical protein